MFLLQLGLSGVAQNTTIHHQHCFIYKDAKFMDSRENGHYNMMNVY